MYISYLKVYNHTLAGLTKKKMKEDEEEIIILTTYKKKWNEREWGR